MNAAVPCADKKLRVLLVTNMYPLPDCPYYGVFVQEQVESLRKRGALIDILFINGRRSKLAYMSGVFKIIHKVWFNRHRYDLILAHHGYASLIARLQFQLPLVAMIHAAVARQHGLEPFFARFAVLHADLPVIVNRSNYQVFGRKKALIQCCGVDFARFCMQPQSQARERLGMEAHARIVLFAADPSRRHKRFDLVRQAVDLVATEGVAVNLLTFGNYARETIPTLMNAADALVMVSDYESGPLVVKEAVAVGLPVVSVACGEVLDICRDNPTAFVVEQTVDGLAGGLRKALAISPETRRSYAKPWFDHDSKMDELARALQIVAGHRNGYKLVYGNAEKIVTNSII
jgi:teichuronic acid biosynthesis glycosyltransferase TuaC